MREAPRSGRAAVIFDRDGVLNVDHGYVGHADRLEWTPGAIAAVAQLNRAGILVIVATNQSGVARGFFELADVDRLHAVMQADLAAHGRACRRLLCLPLPSGRGRRGVSPP